MIDLAYRTAYRVAYRGMRAYWAIAKPNTHGALVALWKGNAILLVRTSYHGYWSLPGGYVRPGESAVKAALRELREEVGVSDVEPSQLTLVYDETRPWEGKRDHVEIFALEVAEPPMIAIDHREIIDARFIPGSEALGLDLFPPIADVIRARQSR